MDIHVFVHEGLLVPIFLALVFAFSNGYRDSSTIVASVVSTRVLTPNKAFVLCSFFEFVGAMFIGSAVAATIQRSVLSEGFQVAGADLLLVLTAALTAAIVWGILSWWRALPASNGHALLAGLFGAGWAMWGIGHIQSRLVLVITLVLIASPIIGFLLSIAITSVVRWAASWLTIRTKPVMEALHVFSCFCVALACGSNGGQLALGALLPLAALVPGDHALGPFRVMVAVALSTGVLFGGRRILKKMGMKFYRIRDTQGLGAGVTSASTILTCAWAGFPVSATQVIAGSIVGAGVAKSPRSVRWLVVQEIMLSWIITLPFVAAFAFVACKFLMALMGTV